MDNKESNLRIYEMLTAFFVTISKGEQIIDSIKEVLTTFDLFHPLVLFKYLTKGNPILQPKHILTFLQENNISAKEQDIKIIFSFQGSKDKMNYSNFLRMVYPYSMTANREITATHLRNYHATENLPITEDILACFLILITQHLQLLKKLEIQKQDSLNTLPKDRISKVLRNIKKLSEKSSSHCEKNPNVIHAVELIYFIKNFTTIQDTSLLYLLRRLGTNHLGSIEIEKLQAFLKSWKKKQPTLVQDSETDEQQEVRQKGKRFNEQNYRKQLNLQLQLSLSDKKIWNSSTSGQKVQISPHRNTKRDSSIKIKQGQFCSKNTQENNLTKHHSQLTTPPRQTPILAKTKQSSLSRYQQKYTPSNQSTHPIKLFIKFVTVFLKNTLQIEKLKQQLNKTQINYLNIFKELDTQQRGIITTHQLESFYKRLGGDHVSINFNVLIEAFSQTSEHWLSYSEFCEIFKPSIERTEKSRTSSKSQHIPQTVDSQKRLFCQILYSTLMNEYELLQIRRQFTKQQLFNLFPLINKEKTNFLNYQQLKYFLSEHMSVQLSMYQLMLVLKRLDKCKNGVVSENQFVDYFLVKM